MKSIFNYSDYRRYIQDYFQHRKATERRFSFTVFASEIGFRSKTFMFKVINRQKSLSRPSISKVATAMGLSKKEHDYFEALVCFNEAKSTKEKNYYWEKLNASHKSHKDFQRLRDRFEFFSNVYHETVLNLVTALDFGEDYKKLSRMLVPQIRPLQAQKSVALLLKMDLIRKERGRYVKTGRRLEKQDEVYNLAINNRQRQNMAQAEESLDYFKNELRDISTITFGTNEEGFAHIQKEVAAFRKRLHEMLLKQNAGERICRLNLQLFPLGVCRTYNFKLFS